MTKESLNKREVAEFLRVIDRIDDKALFTLALTTGIRREDIVGIDLSNINWQNNTLTFWEQKKDRFWTVPLEADTMIALKMYINTLSKGSKKLFDFTGRTAYNRLHRYTEKAKIKKKIPFHALRTTFVKRSKEVGRDIKAVQQITGDSERTILKHYSEWTMDELKEIIEKKPILEVEERK